MDSLEIKSIGLLAVEMYTAELEIEAGNESALDRRHDLGNIITGRTIPLLGDMGKYRAFQAEFMALRGIVRDLWAIKERIEAFPDVEFCSYDQLYDMAASVQQYRRLDARKSVAMLTLNHLIKEG